MYLKVSLFLIVQFEPGNRHMSYGRLQCFLLSWSQPIISSIQNDHIYIRYIIYIYMSLKFLTVKLWENKINLFDFDILNSLIKSIDIWKWNKAESIISEQEYGASGSSSRRCSIRMTIIHFLNMRIFNSNSLFTRQCDIRNKNSIHRED